MAIRVRASLISIALISALSGSAIALDSTSAVTTPPDAAATVPGPVPGTRMTEAYVRMVTRDTYFWAWPIVNVYSRRLVFKDIPYPGLLGGTVPVAPLNELSMLHGYVDPVERAVACPNQDVVYGIAMLALDVEPVVIQVPDFGERFWVYQVVDTRTDSFADLGKMYGTKPGFYLLAGPNWHGTVPKGIAGVFRAKTNTGVVIPRVFMDDTPQDLNAVQAVINQIDVYPLSKFDGKPKRREWSKNPTIPAPAGGSGETKWVVPEKFVDELPVVLKDAPALPGEEVRYAQIQSVLDAAEKDPKLKAAMIDEARKTEEEVITPLLQFRNYGVPLPGNWTTQNNGAAFGSDYFTRTAVARSNIFVNKPNETKYFYQDLDADGHRLSGKSAYTVTFTKEQMPPVNGFWSLTLYNEQHFFEPNAIKRYSVGTKNKDLKRNPDGSLTIYVQATPPEGDKRSNWLPSPKSGDFSLYVRAYWPEEAITRGQWTPPAVVKSKG